MTDAERIDREIAGDARKRERIRLRNEEHFRQYGCYHWYAFVVGCEHCLRKVEQEQREQTQGNDQVLP